MSNKFKTDNAKITKHTFKDCNLGTVVFITYANGATFSVELFRTVKDNEALALFIKEKLDKSYRVGYSDGFQDAQAQHKARKLGNQVSERSEHGK